MLGCFPSLMWPQYGELCCAPAMLLGHALAASESCCAGTILRAFTGMFLFQPDQYKLTNL